MPDLRAHGPDCSAPPRTDALPRPGAWYARTAFENNQVNSLGSCLRGNDGVAMAWLENKSAAMHSNRGIDMATIVHGIRQHATDCYVAR